MKKNNLLCFLICFVVVSTSFIVSSCSNNTQNVENSIALKGPNIEVDYSMEELKKLEIFEGLYSTINNWPTEKIYAARGITIESILKDAKLYDDAKLVTIVSRDGYKVSLTRKQILDKPQYYYVDGKEVEEVKSIIAFEYKEDSLDLNEVEKNKPCFIFGQTNNNEHTNPVFIEDVSEIIVSFDEPEKLSNVFTFPSVGNIDKDEKVKLQHKDFGLVKIYYTLDGTDPTVLSTMYNPSTYQPELNVPITIIEDTVIKAFASGYGKGDSDIVTFEFKINQ